MERTTIAIEGPADRVLADGLAEIREVLEQLGDSALVMGGLMTRLWMHLRPTLDIPARATADLDLGFDRKALRISGDRRVVGPMLEEAGFNPGLGGRAFRFTKELPAGDFQIDLLVAPGSSRTDPPVIEAGIPTVAAPGLAYAFARGSVATEVEMMDSVESTTSVLHLPSLDASFVMKANLVGIRTKPGKIGSDTLDAVMLAALCMEDLEASAALVEHRTHGSVRKALKFLDSLDNPTGRVARRVEALVNEEHGASGAGTWAVDVAQRLASMIRQS